MAIAANVSARADDGRVEALPARADVVIIGGGIVGLASALYLSRRGFDTLVLEKGRIGGEQSERAFGWISDLGLDPRKRAMTERTKALWQEIDQESGGSTGYSRCGIVFASSNEREIRQWQNWLDEKASVAPVDARLIEPREASSLLPGLMAPATTSLYGPSDGRIEPKAAVVALAQLARQAGAKIYEKSAVRGLRIEAGRVVGVDTEFGPVAARHVLLAGGAWCRLFCAHHGIIVPQLDIESSLLRTTPLDNAPQVCLQYKGGNFRPSADGSYVIAPDHGHIADITPSSMRFARAFLPALWVTRGLLKLRLGARFLAELRMSSHWRHDVMSPFEQCRVLDAPADKRLMIATFDAVRKAFPVFESAEIADMWAGRIDATPDSTPIISPVASHLGFWIATGFSGYGLTHAPAAGEAIAAAIAGVEPAFNLHPYRLSRFFDGSRLIVRE